MVFLNRLKVFRLKNSINMVDSVSFNHLKQMDLESLEPAWKFHRFKGRTEK